MHIALLRKLRSKTQSSLAQHDKDVYPWFILLKKENSS